MVTVLFAAWWRRVDRLAAEWVLYDASVIVADRIDASTTLSGVGLRATLANAGAGSAYRVKVEGIGCQALVLPHQERRTVGGGRLRRLRLIPVISPGETFTLEVRADPGVWRDAEVAIIWSEPGVWRRARQSRIHIERMAGVLAPEAEDELASMANQWVTQEVALAEAGAFDRGPDWSPPVGPPVRWQPVSSPWARARQRRQLLRDA